MFLSVDPTIHSFLAHRTDIWAVRLLVPEDSFDYSALLASKAVES
jgi:hypothetical protein